MKKIYILVLVLCIFAASLLCRTVCRAISDDSDSELGSDMFTSDSGEVLENIGEGEYVSGGGDIAQTQSLGEGEFRTSSGDLLLDTGAGEYVDSDGETLRGMDD